MRYSILFIFLGLLSCKTSKKIDLEEPIFYEGDTGFHFINDTPLDNAINIAKREGKLIFVDIYTDWCLPCKIMDDEVFSDSRLAEYFNSKFINMKVNAEKGHGSNIADKYNVQAYPTILFLDHKGNIIEKKTGITYHKKLKEMANNALRQNELNGTGG